MKNTRPTMLAFVVGLTACVTPNAMAEPPATPPVTTVVESAPATVPPARPKAVTSEQIAALEQLADNPKYAVSPDTRAAYSPEAAKKIDDLSGPGFGAAYAGTILWFLIAAAPL